MKKLSYLLLFLLSVIAYGCAEEDHPYVGYITVEDAVLPAAGGTTTVTANTDISSPIEMELVGAPDWCTVAINGKEITATATKPNTNPDSRKATVNVRCGYREMSFTVMQQYNGQEHLHDWTGWTATGSDVTPGDGGGYPSLFIDNQSTFWHSQYGPTVPAPHTLVIDMKKELPVAMVRIGRRLAGVNNYATVKAMDVYTSTDNVNFTKVGGFRFDLPWTAPDGTVVTGATNSKIPPFEDVKLSSTVTARYVKLIITETNGSTCQVAYFKAFKQAF